jgi:hypothetical protein
MLADAPGEIDAYRREQKFFGSFFQKRTASSALTSFGVAHFIAAYELHSAGTKRRILSTSSLSGWRWRLILRRGVKSLFDGGLRVCCGRGRRRIRHFGADRH